MIDTGVDKIKDWKEDRGREGKYSEQWGEDIERQTREGRDTGSEREYGLERREKHLE